MADVLSQSQIDELLASLNEEGSAEEPAPEETEPSEYPLYDFYSPKKFTKDKLKIISNVHEHYARVVTSLMSSLFRLQGQAELITVEEQRYYEFRNALGDHDILTFASVSMPNCTKNPPIVMHISQLIVLDIVDHMLGGLGEDLELEEEYSYTDIEKELYKTVVKYLISAMPDSWAGFVKMDTAFSQIEDSNSVQKSIGMDEIVVICILKLTLENISGKITICLPSALLDNMFKIFDKQDILDEDEWQARENTRKRIMSNLKDSSLDVVAQLGNVSMNVDDICNLHPGDVLNLNRPKDSAVSLLIEGMPWYQGVLGVHKKNFAIEIQQVSDAAELAKEAEPEERID